MKVTKKQIFVAAILVIVFVQAPHLMSEFANMSDLPDGWALSHGSMFAIAIDFCVLIFAMRGRTLATVLFMIISYVVTIQYYAEYINFSDNWLRSLSTLMISSAGVLAIYYLSEEVKKLDMEDDSMYADKKANQMRDEIRKELETRYNSEGSEIFTKEEQEIIRRKSNNETYQSIIDNFKERNIPISRDKISSVLSRFKSMYTNI